MSNRRIYNTFALAAVLSSIAGVVADGPWQVLSSSLTCVTAGLLVLHSEPYAAESRVAEELMYFTNAVWWPRFPRYYVVAGWGTTCVGLAILALFPSHILAAADALGVHWVVIPAGVLVWAAGVYWVLRRGARISR
ncbi:hypothetical protein [Megalodesulfovibrio paquesii]